ncbi:MAG: J domain-containing protein [Rhodospirillales bacterium]|nr:J domain-containing protein [Acetobacter sp.]
MSTDASLIPSPELDAVRQDCETLRGEVARLLTEAHDLIHITKPHLLAVYQSKLGAWELRRLEAQCAVARLKRKIALVQACVNRGEPVRPAAVEQQLETEFAAWQQQIADAAHTLAGAERHLSHLMAPEDAAELRRLYRTLVKNLHPDLHPDQGNTDRLLWLRVQEAYGRSDLEEIRALTLLLEKPADRVDDPAPTTASAKDKLLAESDGLKAQVKRLLMEMDGVRSQPPFTMQRDLEDDAWVADRRAALDADRAALVQQREALEKYLAQIMPADDEPVPPVFGRN